MKTLGFYLLIFSLFCAAANAQVIHGRVVDSASNDPVPGAIIYFEGTYLNTASKADGTFDIKAPKEKTPIVISAVGYKSLHTLKYPDNNFIVVLRGKTLGEVTITDHNTKNHDREMRIFLREFIGSTSDKNCIIQNPDDIKFSYNDKNYLVVKADKPLIIFNKKLGYKITYFLSNFIYKHNMVSYSGNYFFEDAVANLDERQVEQVRGYRNQVYIGSRMQFIRALWHDALRQDMFYMASGRSKIGIINNEMNTVLPADVLISKNGGTYFVPGDLLYVTYEGFWSTLASVTPGSGSYITANGYYDANISWWGYLADDRVNKLLPLEFQPDVKPLYATL